MINAFKLISTILISLILVNCSPKNFEVTQFSPENSQDRVIYYSHQMSLSTPQSTYTHIATIQPHNLGGNLLQATGFEKDGNYAFVSYNTEGNIVRGGLDIIQLSSLNSPTLVSSIVSEDSEYAELKIKNNYLYMVGQKKTPSRNYAVLTVINVSNKALPVVASELVFTDGWYATSLDIEGSKVFITVPNVGIKEVDITNPTALILNSTKSVSGNSLFTRRYLGNSLILGGTNTHNISKLTSSSVVTNLFTITNQEQEAPARFSLKGNTLLTNAGYTGFKIIDNMNTTPVLKSTTTLTGRGNGITHGSCNMAYLAQGEEGLLTFNLENLNNPVNLGRFDFADAQEDCGSANNVFYMSSGNDHYVFVADGLGGVKIVKVVYSDSLCSCETEGLLCKVYDLSVTQPSLLPNFSTLTPVGTFVTNSLNVTPQTWANSFPLFPTSLKTMKEWYGIVCEGTWKSTKAQEITLSLGSDDGSKLYFNNLLEINNDGLHSPLTLTKKVNVLVQNYPVKIEYYQGPQTQIQLELKYQSVSDPLQYMMGFSH